MALNLELETLEGLSEDVQQHYAEVDGKFILQAVNSETYTIEKDISKLTKALESEKHQASQLRTVVKSFEGIDADEARKANQTIEELRKATPSDKLKEQHEAQKAELVNKHNEALAAIGNEVTSRDRVISNLMIDNVALQAFDEMGGKPGAGEFILPYVHEKTAVKINEDGTRTVNVLGDEGVPRIGGTDGKLMQLPQLIAEMKKEEKFKMFFEGTNASGVGAPADGGNDAGLPIEGQVKKLSEFNAMLAKDQHAFVAGGGKVE